MPEDLRCELADGVATLILDRPQRRNAFTEPMLRAWAEALRRAHGDDAVRVIVVAGAGGAFCSGVDIDQLVAVDPTPLARKRFLTEQVHDVVRAIRATDKPTIAAIEGPAIGAGLDMALACDLRVAAQGARLAAAYVRAGLVPGDGGSHFLPRLVGLGRALELLLTGDELDGERAERIGLVNRVVPDGHALGEARAIAFRLAALPQTALRMTKRSIYQCAELPLDAALELLSSQLAVAMSTQETAEALAALRGRRTRAP